MMFAYIVMMFVLLSVLILYWFLPSIMDATLPFGVRIPPQRVDEPVIASVRRIYHVGLVVIGLLVGAASWFVAINYVPVLAGAGAVLAVVILLGINYYIAHQRLLQVKEREHWYEGLRQVVMVDTSTHQQPIRPDLIWLVLALILLAMMIILSSVPYSMFSALTPPHIDKSSSTFVFPVTAILLTGLLTWIAYVLPNGRQQLDPTHPEEDSQHQHRVRKSWSNALLWCASIINMMFLVLELFNLQILTSDTPGSRIISTTMVLFIPIALIVLIGYLAVKNIRGSSQRKQGQDGPPPFVARDDDRYWIAGMFYVNPNDAALMIPRRFGIGWTMNFGHPLAKFTFLGLGLFFLLIMLLPFLLQGH